MTLSRTSLAFLTRGSGRENARLYSLFPHLSIRLAIVSGCSSTTACERMLGECAGGKRD